MSYHKDHKDFFITDATAAGDCDSTGDVTELMNVIKISKSRQQQKEKEDVCVDAAACDLKLYIHSNFMDTIELAYLLDYYVNESHKSCRNFCVFLFGPKKGKENAATIKSMVIPNEYIREFGLNLADVVKDLSEYLKSMYKSYSKYELVAWVLVTSRRAGSRLSTEYIAANFLLAQAVNSDLTFILMDDKSYQFYCFHYTKLVEDHGELDYCEIDGKMAVVKKYFHLFNNFVIDEKAATFKIFYAYDKKNESLGSQAFIKKAKKLLEITGEE